MTNNKRLFPSEQETLQHVMTVVFGPKHKQTDSAASKIRWTIYKFGLVFGTIIVGISVLTFIVT